MPAFETECFFITPIGAAGSDTRQRSDGVLNYIVKPAALELDLQAVRADELGQPGQITHQVIEHVLRAKAAVADLTGANANVYYELAVRHAARLPVVLIADEEERSALPFDLSQMRTIFFDHTDLASAAQAKDEIVVHLRQALDGAVDSPVATAINLQALEGGSRVEQTLADLLARVDQLSASHRELVGLISVLTTLPPFLEPSAVSPLARSLAADPSRRRRDAATLLAARDAADATATEDRRERERKKETQDQKAQGPQEIDQEQDQQQ